MACLAIKERPLMDRQTEHLLQTDSLSAKLGTIAIIALRAATLVFDRVRIPSSTRVGQLNPRVLRVGKMKLHRVGNPCQAKPKRTHAKLPYGPNVSSGFIRTFVHSIVHHCP